MGWWARRKARKAQKFADIDNLLNGEWRDAGLDILVPEPVADPDTGIVYEPEETVFQPCCEENCIAHGWDCVNAFREH
jgi:hypothetical protein